MLSKQKIGIIGGGILGLATAYKLNQFHPDLKIQVLEKETDLGQHQTTNNSGVLHAGLYYKPGSAKAKFAVQGIQEMVKFCQHHHIPHEICGKLVVATTPDEQPCLQTLFQRGMQNGLLGLRLLKGEELNEIEPFVQGIGGIHVPQEGIVDYKQVCNKLAQKIQQGGGQITTGAKVTGLKNIGSQWRILTSQGDFQADFVVNCAGLYCDRISQLAGESRTLRIIPFRGEYYKLKPARHYLVKNLIYPVPDPRYPFLGVHFTRLIQGGIEAGPNAVLALAREGYRKSYINVEELADILTYPGFWRLAAQYWQTGLEEMVRSFSKSLFCQSLQRLVPEIQMSDLEMGGSGIRAQAVFPDGEMAQDFCLVTRSNALHVLNAPSPAATASLAIGQEIVAIIAKYL